MSPPQASEQSLHLFLLPQRFVATALRFLKDARRRLAASGATREEKRPLSQAIRPLKEYRMALLVSSDPCSLPLPSI